MDRIKYIFALVAGLLLLPILASRVWCAEETEERFLSSEFVHIGLGAQQFSKGAGEGYFNKIVTGFDSNSRGSEPPLSLSTLSAGRLFAVPCHLLWIPCIPNYRLGFDLGWEGSNHLIGKSTYFSGLTPVLDMTGDWSEKTYFISMILDVPVAKKIGDLTIGNLKETSLLFTAGRSYLDGSVRANDLSTGASSNFDVSSEVVTYSTAIRFEINILSHLTSGMELGYQWKDFGALNNSSKALFPAQSNPWVIQSGTDLDFSGCYLKWTMTGWSDLPFDQDSKK